MHHKPLGLLDVEGYYRSLVTFLDGAVAEGFAPATVRDVLVVEREPEALLERLGGLR
jgi:predicted Rossmann-fold nucleotide-binding protein